MAVIFKNQEDEKLKESQQPQTINVGSVAPVTPSSSQTTKASNSPTSSGRFTNLKSYIDANQGFNQQGGGLAGKIATNLSNQGQEVKAQVQSAADTFKSQRDEQLKPLEQGVQNVQQAVANPIAFTQNQQNVESVQRARDAEYTGPRSLMDLQGRQNQAILNSSLQNFKDNTNQARTETGRFNLLRNMFGRPTYSSGQQNLDNLLIQGQKQQQQRMNETGRIAADVNRNLNQISSNAETQGREAVTRAQQIQADTRKALNDRVLKEQQSIEDATVRARMDQDRKLYTLAKGLQQGQITKQDAEMLGLNANDRLYNANLGTLLQRTDPTLQTVADQNNYNQLQALRNLLGNTYTPETSAILDQFKDSNQAGQFQQNLYKVDKGSVQKTLTDKRDEFTKASQSAQSDISKFTKSSQDLARNIAIQQDRIKNPNKYGISEEGLFEEQGVLQDLQRKYKDSQTQLASANNRLNQVKNQFNYNNALSIMDDSGAIINDYDQIDPLTGMSKGEQLLRSLGLLPPLPKD